jgi:nucleoside phosphorylase
MRVLVTFAVEAEFAPWRKLRQFVSRTDGHVEIQSARVGEVDVHVLLTGVGCRSAWLETTKVVWDGDVDICISSGLAGALREEYSLGDVLAAKNVNPSGGERTVRADQTLLALAVEAGARAVNSFYTTDTVIQSAREKRELGKIADAVEMESAEVLYEAAAFGARVIAIRAISDSLNEDLPLNFNKVVNAAGEVSVSRILGELARHPAALPGLMRFGRQSQAAAERLCAFLDKYIEAVVGVPVLAAKGLATP